MDDLSPKMLIIETSSDVCSTALYRGDIPISVVEAETRNSHAETLGPAVEQLFKSAEIRPHELSCIAVSKGPGSYTGLRIGASLAKGLAMALQIPLIGVDTLCSLALYARDTLMVDADEYYASADARRMEVYWKRIPRTDDPLSPEYEDMEASSILFDEDQVQKLKGAQESTFCFLGTGGLKLSSLLEGVSNYNGVFATELSATMHIKYVLQKYNVERFENIFSYSPYYFKAPNITKSKKSYF